MREKNFWTYEKCKEIAEQCENRKEFRIKYPGGYDKSINKKWINDFFPSLNKKPNGYWTYEKCKEESKKYDSYLIFHKNNLSAYMKSFRKGWIFDFYWLKDDRGLYDMESKKYTVYKYYWEETNTVYVGLTKNLKERDNDHRKYKIKNGKKIISTVKKYAEDNGFNIPKPIILDENLNGFEAKEKEEYWVNFYKTKNYNVINIAKTGVKSSSIGGSIKKWTFETVYEEAKKYTSRTDFQKKSYGCYRSAKKNGWLDKIEWLKPKIHPNGYWTYEKCLEHAKKYKNLKELYENDFKAYRRDRDFKWLEQINKDCYE